MILYILRSTKTRRYYIGSTEDLAFRLEEHNHPEKNRSRWTRGGGPGEVVYSREFRTGSGARRAENFVKAMKSREFIGKLISGEYNLDQFDSSG
jgi:putative endonuclease